MTCYEFQEGATYVVTDDEDNGQRNNSPSSTLRTRVGSIRNSSDKLTDTTKRHTNHEELSSTTNLGYNSAVNNNGHDTECTQDAAIFECVADVCHFEEIRSVS